MFVFMFVCFRYVHIKMILDETDSLKNVLSIRKSPKEQQLL